MAASDTPLQVQPCWICSSQSVSPWKRGSIKESLVSDDFKISDGRYGVTLALVKCHSCGFVYAPDARSRDIAKFYEDLSDVEYVESLDSRSLQMSWIVRELRKLAPDAKTALDIGAGAGTMIRAAAKFGLTTVGVEPSVALVKQARSDGVSTMLQGVFPHPDLVGRTFDCIFLVDVIEHVVDPVALLKSCEEALANGGIIVLVTPNLASIPARLLGHKWWHFRIAHIGYFSKLSLKAIAGNCQLSIHKVMQAKWFFPLGYLLQRLEAYLPIAWFNRLLSKTTVGRKIFQLIVPLCLFDSHVVFLAKKGS